MAINLGDATLVFIGDQTNLDAAFASVPPKAEKSFGAASKVVQTFNGELDATGENVRFAGEKILSLRDAFRTLSIQGPELLKQKLDDAKNAFSTLQQAGVTAQGTLLQATIKVTEREIAYRKAIGDSTAALAQELAVQRASYENLGGAAASAGVAIQEAGTLSSHAFHEARGSLALMGEEVGIRLPRELRGFIAQLPGVGSALSLAFEATAVIALISVIAEVTKKVTEWISDTYIFTEAMKASNESIARHNETLQALAGQLKTAKEAYAAVGLEGSKKTAESIHLLNEEFAKNSTALADAKKHLDSLTDSTTAFQEQNAAQIGEAQSVYGDLFRTSQVFEQQRLTLQKQYALERRAEQAKENALLLQSHKAAMEAFIEYDTQARRLLLAQQGTLANQETLIEAQKNERLYQEQLKYLQDKRAAMDKDASATKAAKEAADSEILNLETKHAADMLRVQADLAKGISELVANYVIKPWHFADEDLKTHTLQMADNLLAFAVATEKSLRRSENAVIIFARVLAETGSKTRAFGAVMTGIFDQVTIATASAFTQAILGQKSLGAALAEGTKAELAAVAGRATAWALYYTAHGIADTFWNPPRAAADFTSAAIMASIGAIAAAASVAIPSQTESGGSPAAPANLPPSPATTAAPAPPAPINPLRLAGGALVSAPTLAIVGDSMNHGRGAEAVIPLDDSRALDAITNRLRSDIALPSPPDFYAALREAFGERITHIYNFKGDLIDHGTLMRQQSRMVKRGRARTTVNESLRVTKRA